YITYIGVILQAEDSIRDRNLTGVQTCALPISTDTPLPIHHHHRYTTTDTPPPPIHHHHRYTTTDTPPPPIHHHYRYTTTDTPPTTEERPIEKQNKTGTETIHKQEHNLRQHEIE